MNDVDIVNCSDLNDKQHEVQLTQSEPVGGGVKHLRHDVHHQIKQVAASLSPVQRLVLVQGVQSEIPGIDLLFGIYFYVV